MNSVGNEIIKLNKTNFCNPHGLACKYSYSNVKDCSIIAAYAMENYKIVRDVVKTKKFCVNIWNC